MAPDSNNLRGRPAHTPGTTVLTYTPNGRQVITGGSNSAIRIFSVGEHGEPKTIDEGVESHLAIAATNDSLILGSEDGTVWLYDLRRGTIDKPLVRCTLPIRDLAISKDEEWVAVASDELTVKIVSVNDITEVKYLRDQTKGVKHVTFDPSGRFVTVSCADGIIYIYSFTETEPTLLHKLDGVIQRLETDHEATSSAVWHPDGTAFAAVEATRDITVISSRDWTKQKKFSGGHNGDITCLAWSPNGALLASAGADRKILLWETRTQRVIKSYDIPNVINFRWHPTQNAVAFTTSDGELFIYDDFVPSDHYSLLSKTLEVAPLLSIGSHEGITISHRLQKNDISHNAGSRQREDSPDSLDDILGPADDFVEDDDGAGYTENINGHGKRTNTHMDDLLGHDIKRRSAAPWKTIAHEPFQPGSTPWRGNRRYLALNLVGFVWTVDQDTHNTVTVEFYDRERYRDFHFTDPYLYDKACLNEKGTLFSCQPTSSSPATVFYRPHETWTTRADWRTELPQGEKITAIALSNSYITVCTSTDYVRIYTLFGTPYRVFRQKSRTVTCAAWRDYIMTIGNGPSGSDGVAQLKYSIENVRRDEICQNEDTVALAGGTWLQSVFFSDKGDPCIYDSSGVLLVLQHWRKPGQARWVPLLDTKLLERVASGRKEETYWPVAVAQDVFHCIILKGGDKYPYFPRPLLTEFDFQMPVSSIDPKDKGNKDGDTEMDDAEEIARNKNRKLQESLVRTNLDYTLLEDCIEASEIGAAGDTELRRKALDIDKILLQLLDIECREGEERGMKALELVTMFRDRSGGVLNAASKVAQRYRRSILDDKIRAIAERRLMGEDDDDDITGDNDDI
ncbi:DNA polymerase alpha accessory factor Mcl1 [Microsporum canis]|uniref:Minichromosome loss protein 1 n=1 Tax=Arthroderma otae (strain ATCC MYA-4605 / CBS 113480) TaxID=554155 RepID=C5FRK7_ARTOC|nr:minichromosome loss protein 1 [Microsporum canis CBS 113480]EEQ32510.1 minichromosome loss protein 1 [Microsporum canis CBS 113480]